MVADALKLCKKADCRSGMDGVSQQKRECILKQRSL
jgi:hypothetical protein